MLNKQKSTVKLKYKRIQFIYNSQYHIKNLIYLRRFLRIEFLINITTYALKYGIYFSTALLLQENISKKSHFYRQSKLIFKNIPEIRQVRKNITVCVFYHSCRKPKFNFDYAIFYTCNFQNMRFHPKYKEKSKL